MKTEISSDAQVSKRCFIQKIPVDRVTMDKAVDRVARHIQQKSGPPLLILGSNAHVIITAVNHPRFAEALKASQLSVSDGMSVVWASHLLRAPVPERVPCGELMERICSRCAESGATVFFLGGLPGAADAAARNLVDRYPRLKVVGTYCPPYGFERDVEEERRIRGLINDASPDLLVVALGVPKQEIWMHEQCLTMPIRAAIAVGAALDTQAGLRQRAPNWTHKLGVEWLYRLVLEPRRLARRYILGNPYFMFLVLKQLFSPPLSKP